MTRVTKYSRALPLLAVLLLGGCDVSPLEVETVSRNRIMWVEDERETDEYMLRLTSPIDSVGFAGSAGQVARGTAS